MTGPIRLPSVRPMKTGLLHPRCPRPAGRPRWSRLAAATAIHGVEAARQPGGTGAHRAVRGRTGRGGRGVPGGRRRDPQGVAGYAGWPRPGTTARARRDPRAACDWPTTSEPPSCASSPAAEGRPAATEADATAARRLGAAAEYAGRPGRTDPAGDPRLAPHRRGRDPDPGPGRPPSRRARCGTSCTPGSAASSRRRPTPALAPYLGYVQVKDIASAEDTTPLPLGAGVLPLAECVEVLSRADWDGWLCWEYEKRWYPEAAAAAGAAGPAQGAPGPAAERESA